MESVLKDVEPRMQKVVLQLKNEIMIFERLMYKNANQHRRALYFRRLGQVRRDLRLLLSAHLTDLIQSVVQYFGFTSNVSSLHKGRQQSKHPSSELQVLKRRLCGVARLLEQMSDPILNASSQVAGLLGQTFFMPFALTMFSILARLRVLLLQCLHDVVQVFNVFSAWASELGHSDGKSCELPDSLECKWDGTKMMLVATSTNHGRDANVESKGFVEDSNGRKYSTLGSLVSAQVAMELERSVEITPSADLKAREEDEVPSADVTAPCTDEKLDVHNSTEKPHVFLVQELNEEDRAKESGTRGDLRIVPKRKVAYVSVEPAVKSASILGAEKTEEEMHPPKKQKKDALFDMLLGLGDELRREGGRLSL